MNDDAAKEVIDLTAAPCEHSHSVWDNEKSGHVEPITNLRLGDE